MSLRYRNKVEKEEVSSNNEEQNIRDGSQIKVKKTVEVVKSRCIENM